MVEKSEYLGHHRSVEEESEMEFRYNLSRVRMTI